MYCYKLILTEALNSVWHMTICYIDVCMKTMQSILLTKKKKKAMKTKDIK